MLAPINHLLHESTPPGAVSLALAVFTGAFVGLAVIPIAAIALSLALVLIVLRHAWHGASHWLGWAARLGLLADLEADAEHTSSGKLAHYETRSKSTAETRPDDGGVGVALRAALAGTHRSGRLGRPG